MSEHQAHHEIPKAEFFKPQSGGSLLLGFGAGALVGLIGAAVGYFVSREQFAFSWLFAFAYFFTILGGSLFWVILHHATNAGWSTVVRRQVENLSSLFPWLLVLFIPIFLVGHDYLYSWMRIDPDTDHILHGKSAYLNTTGFWVRSALYLIYFTVAALWLRKISVTQDGNGNPLLTLKMRKLAFIFLPFFGLSITFAGIDWLMTLDYTWYSTMWGVYIFAGAAGSSMAVLILLITGLKNAGYLKDVVSIQHYHIMGKLLFAFTVFWGYIGFSQYMLIWYSNVTEETSYFLRRNTDSWHTLSLILVIGHFFIPFLLLLGQRLKKTPTILCFIAGWVLCMHALDIYIIVMPILHREGFSPSILDLCAFVGIGSVLGLAFVRGLGQRSLFCARDPRLVESLHVKN